MFFACVSDVFACCSDVFCMFSKCSNNLNSKIIIFYFLPLLPRLVSHISFTPQKRLSHVMYKFGMPVEVQPKDFEQIRDRYQGNPEGQKWLLTKYMGEDTDGTNLHYVAPLTSAKKLAKYIKANEIAAHRAQNNVSQIFNGYRHMPPTPIQLG